MKQTVLSHEADKCSGLCIWDVRTCETLNIVYMLGSLYP